MSGLSSIAGLLKLLPRSVRKALYVVVVLVGAALALCQMVGVDDLGPFTLDQALALYAYLSPAAGVVAVANVSPPAATDESSFTGFDEDVDLSSFEPVGVVGDVYGDGSA
jgi:hypothetical protein